MSEYPIKATFYTMSGSENGYGEVLNARTVSFSTGARPITVSFKDAMQSQIAVNGERQYLYVRKTPKTLAVKVGDELDLSGVSSKTYEVVAVDPKLNDRRELMFLIDALEVS